MVSGNTARLTLSAGPILKYSRQKSVRVLRPQEYLAIRSEGNLDHMDALLYPGWRYVEAQRCHQNPSWLTGRFVHLPPAAMLKAKRKQLDRWIGLNPPGVSALERYLRGKPLPTPQGWGENLKSWARKAGVDPTGLGPKTLRKTCESWLVSVYPERMPYIVLRQGHTSATSVSYYLNMPFTEEEKAEMKPFVEGVF